MFKYRILLYCIIISSCFLAAFLFSFPATPWSDQVRIQYGIDPNENVIVITCNGDQADKYLRLLMEFNDDEIDKITSSCKNRNKILVIGPDLKDAVGKKSEKIRLKKMPISQNIEKLIELPEFFACLTQSESTKLNEKIRKKTPLVDPLLKQYQGEEKNLTHPFIANAKQNERDRIRLVQVLTFAFAKHQEMCYTAWHETK